MGEFKEQPKTLYDKFADKHFAVMRTLHPRTYQVQTHPHQLLGKRPLLFLHLTVKRRMPSLLIDGE